MEAGQVRRGVDRLGRVRGRGGKNGSLTASSSHLVLQWTNWEKARHLDVVALNQFRKGEAGSPCETNEPDLITGVSQARPEPKTANHMKGKTSRWRSSLTSSDRVIRARHCSPPADHIRAVASEDRFGCPSRCANHRHRHRVQGGRTLPASDR